MQRSDIDLWKRSYWAGVALEPLWNHKEPTLESAPPSTNLAGEAGAMHPGKLDGYVAGRIDGGVETHGFGCWVGVQSSDL